MLTILNVSTGAKEKGITAGVAVGAVIALEAMFAGPVCGASMNPARSLAPALSSAISRICGFISPRRRWVPSPRCSPAAVCVKKIAALNSKLKPHHENHETKCFVRLYPQ